MHNHKPGRRTNTLVWFVVVIVSSCASVKIVPVGNNDKWTEGLRFYRPRPYVAVKEPFVIGGGEVFLPGKVVGNEIVDIDLSHLPPDMRRAFGFYLKDDKTGRFAVDSGRVAEPPVIEPAEDGLRTHSGAPSPAAPSSSDTATVLEGRLKDTGVTPSVLPESVHAFAVKATLSKDTVTDFATTPNVKLGLVPWDDGKYDVGKFVAANLPGDPTVDKTKDLVVNGNGLRSAVASQPNWLVAMTFEGKRSGDVTDKKFIAVDSAPALTVVGATVSNEPKQKQTDIEMKGSGSAKVTTSGNPATNPLVPINRFFDVVYLPDFDEQYAIQVDGGLGSATADLSLENGWMLERAGLSIDNRAIGEFLFKQIDKFTDIGASFLKAKLTPPAAGKPGLTEHALRALNERPVLLKATFLIEAQPGMYPILKPCEKRETCCADPEESRPFYLETPFRPYTVIAWNVVRSTHLELVTSIPSGSSSPKEPPKLSIDDVRTCLQNGFKQDLPQSQLDLNHITLGELRLDSNAPGNYILVIHVSDSVDPWKMAFKNAGAMVCKCLSEKYAVHIGSVDCEKP